MRKFVLVMLIALVVAMSLPSTAYAYVNWKSAHSGWQFAKDSNGNDIIGSGYRYFQTAVSVGWYCDAQPGYPRDNWFASASASAKASNTVNQIESRVQYYERYKWYSNWTWDPWEARGTGNRTSDYVPLTAGLTQFSSYPVNDDTADRMINSLTPYQIQANAVTRARYVILGNTYWTSYKGGTYNKDGAWTHDFTYYQWTPTATITRGDF